MMTLMKRIKNARRIVKPLDPEGAFREALDAHEERHEELKKAAAGVLYVGLKLEGELLELRAEVARLHAAIRSMIRTNNEPRALALIAEKQRLSTELERREAELADVKGDADEATARVIASADERRKLEREKLRTIAMLSVARARKRVHELREREQQGPNRALDEVRAEAARLEGESHLDRELSSDVLTRELGPGLDDDGARTELARIRAGMKPRRVA
jgi:phage shock protein A